MINKEKCGIFYILGIILYISLNEKFRKKNDYDKLANKRDYNNVTFAIITRNCMRCGLFSFYMVYIGCLHKYLSEGYIPIIDLKSFPNVINGFNISKINHWEFFFEQPFGYTLEEVTKNAKNILRITDCNCGARPDERTIYLNWSKKNFWHNLASKYMPVKKEIIASSNKIMKKLFKNSKNILGVFTRGTDYISRRPRSHPIPPNVTDLIHDVQEMDNLYKYDYIFFSTEDEIIRNIFLKYFKKKVKQILQKIKINYDYSKKEFINLNENIFGNIEFNKIYLLNIIILSKCLDIIAARCSGTVGIFVFSNGFRNIKVYDLGYY